MKITAGLLWGSVAALALGATTAWGAPSGALFTTTADGEVVNENHYAYSTDVYLSGGPLCNARNMSDLPDGWYAFKVTDSSGHTDMTAAEPAVERQFRVASGAVVAASDAADHPINVTRCGAVLRVGPFAATSANGEYKLHVVPVAQGGVAVFSPSRTKTDNFRITVGSAPVVDPPAYLTPPPAPTPDPDPVVTPDPPPPPAPTPDPDPVVTPDPPPPAPTPDPDPGWGGVLALGAAESAPLTGDAPASASAPAAAAGMSAAPSRPAANVTAAKAKSAKAKAKAAKAKAAKAKARKARAARR